MLTLQRVQAALSIAGLLYATSPVHAVATVRVDFRGIVALEYNPFGYVPQTITVGDTVWGYYIYETGVADSDPSPSIGRYTYSSGLIRFVVSFEEIEFYSDASQVDAFLQVADQPKGSMLPDKYWFQARNILSDPPALNGTDWMSINLEDTSATALTSDALPPTAPPLEDWTYGRVLWVLGSGFHFGVQLDSVCCLVPTGIESARVPGTRLLPNHPNPSAQSTLIPFTLDRAMSVKLTIHDVSGRKVAELFDGRLGPGPHSLRWNGRGPSGRPVSSGVYFYRLEAGGASVARKLTLVR